MSEKSGFAAVIGAARRSALAERTAEAKRAAPKPSQARASEMPRSKPRRGTKAAARKAHSLGRPAAGKRSDPDYVQVTAWLRAETLLEVDLILRRHRARDGKDRSDLLQELLEKWLASR